MIRSLERLCWLLLLVCAAWARPSAAEPLFGTPIPFDVAPHDLPDEVAPLDVAVGDLNEDGTPDLVLPNYTYAGTISVALGNGDGTFKPRNDYPAGVGNLAVAIADLNGDSHQDVAAGADGAGIWVLLGNGDGTLAAGTEILPAGESTSDIAVGDVNTDGKADLVISSGRMLLGNGDGTFVNSETRLYGAATLAVGDVNGDGKQDVVMPPFGTYGLRVYLGNGDGTFQDVRIYPAYSNSCHSIFIIDLDTDGNPDLVIKDFSGFQVAIGDGSGEFPTSTHYNAESGDSGSPLHGQGAAVGDLNADGILDIALTRNFAPGLYVWLGAIDGTFGDVVYAQNEIYGDQNSYAVATADLDVDGRMDLISVGETLLNIGPLPRPKAPVTSPGLSIRTAGPVGKSLTLRYRASTLEPATVEVFDVHGRLAERRVVHPSGPSQDTSFESLRSGVYLIRLTQAGKTAISRGVVVR